MIQVATLHGNNQMHDFLEIEFASAGKIFIGIFNKRRKRETSGQSSPNEFIHNENGHTF